MPLHLLASGLSSAFAPTMAGTLEGMATQRAPFFLNPAFIGRDFRPQLCTFRDKLTVGAFDNRAHALLDEATDDFVQRAEGHNLRGQSMQLVLVLPEVDPDEGLDRERLGQLGTQLRSNLADALFTRLGLEVVHHTVRASGHAGVGAALSDALTTPSDTLLLIAAVDSYSDRTRLNRLNNEKRLFSKESAFGLVPGEAAGLMLFTPQSADGAVVCGAGNAVEEIVERLEAEGPLRGLSDAAFAACEMALAPKNRVISAWYADWNNSRYRATELAFAIHRINPFFLAEGIEPSYPALNFGDVGAAFGILALALAGERRAIEGQSPYQLISAASVLNGLRSTILIQGRT